MKALSQPTLIELARAGAVRGDTVHGYLLSVQYGLYEAELTTKHSGARIETAFVLLRTLHTAAVEVRLTDAAPSPRPYRLGRPAGLVALDQLHAEATTLPPASPRTRSPHGLNV